MSGSNGTIIVASETPVTFLEAQMLVCPPDELWRLFDFTRPSEEEVWCQIFDYRNGKKLWPYLASSHGRVMSLGGRRGSTPGYIMSEYGEEDYRYVYLSQPGVRWQPQVNILVTWMFHGPKPGEEWDAHHIDRNPRNNVAWNLQWLPSSVNRGNTSRKKYEVAPGVFKTMSELTDEEFSRVIPF